MRQAIANPDEDMILAIIDGKKHDMPKTAGEMRHIMEFFAKNLALRNLAMEAMPDVILISEGKSMK
ncbi:hypothetical protein BC829DRAFT_64878 [Chytridium lagenaria]|nr:hypothetical protein BC829DRAFT_64878 [Chytridium lagenaria]